MEPLTPGRVTSRAGSPSLSHRAFPPFCPQPPHGAPSSLLCSPQLCQRDGLPVPFQIPAFLMPLGVRQVWASHTPSRLAAPCSRNGFVILRTGGSPSVALHPALRQRSYFRFRVGGAYPEGTCTPLTLRLGGALGAGRARETIPSNVSGLFAGMAAPTETSGAFGMFAGMARSYRKIERFRDILGHGSRHHPPFPPKWSPPADRGREGRLSSRSPLPPNRTGGFPASGSPVSGFHSGTGGRPRRLQQA